MSIAMSVRVFNELYPYIEQTFKIWCDYFGYGEVVRDEPDHVWSDFYSTGGENGAGRLFFSRSPMNVSYSEKEYRTVLDASSENDVLFDKMFAELVAKSKSYGYLRQVTNRDKTLRFEGWHLAKIINREMELTACKILDGVHDGTHERYEAFSELVWQLMITAESDDEIIEALYWNREQREEYSYYDILRIMLGDENISAELDMSEPFWNLSADTCNNLVERMRYARDAWASNIGEKNMEDIVKLGIEKTNDVVVAIAKTEIPAMIDALMDGAPINDLLA